MKYMCKIEKSNLKKKTEKNHDLQEKKNYERFHFKP